MPTLNITAPGVNFKSAAPGSRGSFGCFGIRLDQSTSITSTGSAKTLTENELSHRHPLPQLVNFTCCHGCLLKAIDILDEHCSAVLLDPSGKNAKTHLDWWKNKRNAKRNRNKYLYGLRNLIPCLIFCFILTAIPLWKVTQILHSQQVWTYYAFRKVTIQLNMLRWIQIKCLES